MKWIEDDGDYRLDGIGSEQQIVNDPIPKKADFLLLNKIRVDLVHFIERESLVYKAEYLDDSAEEVGKAAMKLVAAMSLMPAAYAIEVRKSNRPKSLRELARNVAWAIARKL